MTRIASLGVLALVAGLSLGTGPAWAVPALVSANPAINSRVAAPKAIDLVFNEPLNVSNSMVVLRGRNGKALNTGVILLNPGNNRRLHVPVTTAPGVGPVTVEWTVMSRAGQQRSGKFGFTVIR